MNKYYLGNALRGYFEGEFKSKEEALLWLSRRFLISYPSSSGRHIYMCVSAENSFGIEQTQVCYKGLTQPDLSLDKFAVTDRCKRSAYMY